MAAPPSTQKLSKPILPQLNNEAVLLYRKSYQSFRSGAPVGAQGEEPEAVSSGHDADINTIDNDNFKNTQVYREITNYRTQYRMHRRGEAHGAKGEVTTLSFKMSIRHAMALPVSQLRNLARHRAQAALEVVESEFHVHVGAGKLGLGLVIPAIAASKQPFAVVQRPSGAWSAITKKEKGTVGMKVNGKPTIEGLELVTNQSGIPDDLDTKCPKMFALTDDDKILDALVFKATTFSVSLGPVLNSVMGPLLKRLPKKDEGKRPALYACENDHKAVHELSESLKGRVDVVDCMVDRICTERTISADWVEIGTESHPGEIVVISPPKAAPLPPFTGDHVQIPRLQAEAEYFCQRKLIMVNGMHTTLAFTTLCNKEPGALNGDSWKEHTLLTPETATAEENSRLWLWAVARLLYIMWEHEPEIIKAAHHVKSDEEVCAILLKYAKQTLGRFSTVVDKAGRVLGGGVANRWEGRLKGIDDFLRAEPPIKSGIRHILLKQAGIQEADMRKAVTQLVEESKRFVGVNVQKTKVVVT